MADGEETAGGPLPLDLLEAGDPAFVDAIRAVADAGALADFAGRWYDDPRPGSRRLLLEYLDRPLNAYRHEGLVKRLFKRAEAAGDDEVMGRFLVLLDRSIRRVRGTRLTRVERTVATEGEADDLQRAWEAAGYAEVIRFGFPGHFQVLARRPDAVLVPRWPTMPRGRMVEHPNRPFFGRVLVPDWAVTFGLGTGQDPEAAVDDVPGLRQELGGCRLFSVATRHHLRRRAWRYFRELGRREPGRYVAAVAAALLLYRDEDAADERALLDNWGLVQILFHHCPALRSTPRGWALAPGRSPADLAPAPIFGPAWDEAPAAVVGLLARARCRAVRIWAVLRAGADPARALASLPVEGWVDLLGHDDPDVVALAARLLPSAEGLDAVEPSRWLALAESARPEALEAVCDLIARHFRAERVTLEEAARLAMARALPTARLGFDWLRAKGPRPGEADRLLLGLVEADCGPLRPEILRWLREVLAGSGEVDPGTILEFLDGRHADARAEGWAWFLAEPRARDDPETWRRLLESPHDDVRLALIAELERREAAGPTPADPSRALDAESLRALWASALLDVRRGSRARPAVVRQVVRRLEARPDDAPALLPLLGLALRSIRGPERRAGLAAVVRLAEGRAEVGPLVRSSFPELQWA